MKIGTTKLRDQLVAKLMAATREAIGDFEKVSGAYEGKQIGIGLKSFHYDDILHPSVSVVADLQSDENWTPNLPDEEVLRNRFLNFVEFSEYNAAPKRFKPTLFQLQTKDGVLLNVMIQAKFELGLPRRKRRG